MKRIAASVIAVLIIVLCCSCGTEEVSQQRYPLRINSTPIDGEVFTYFLDVAFGAMPQQTKEERIYYATQMCIQYVAVNSTFSKEGLRLDSGEQIDVSNKVNTDWSFFGRYYEKIGVSKQTFIKINLSDAYTEKLRRTYFGDGGTEEVPEESLRAYLSEKYVAFRVIMLPKTVLDDNGNEVARTAEQENALTEKLNAGLAAINVNHTSIESVYATFVSDRNGDREQYAEIVTDGSDHRYPPEFVAAVRNLSMNTAAVFDFAESLYVVYREDVSSDEDIFEEYKNECLNALTDTELQNKIAQIGIDYSSVKDQNAVNDLYEAYVKATAR